MRKSFSFRWLKACLILIAITVSISLNSQNKPAENGVKLVYKFSGNKPYKYLRVNKIVQSMDVGGQTMDVNVSSVMGCTIKSAGVKDNNLILDVKIDSVVQTMDTPQGGGGGEITDAKGKSFTMVLATDGKELDITGAKKITFSVEGSGQSDASQSFADFFPDLPAGTVSPGYKWSDSDTSKSGSTAGTTLLVVKSANTFDGYEDVNGIKCAKISSVVEGTETITSQTQGMDIFISGPFTGTGTFLFSIENGYFVKQLVKTRLVGKVDITGAQEMSFPLVMDTDSKNELLK
jgi:hypothetical protein